MQMQIKLIRRFLLKSSHSLRHYKTSLGDTIIIKYFLPQILRRYSLLNDA